MKNLAKGCFFIAILLLQTAAISHTVKAQNAEAPPLREGYLTPPDEIASEVLAPRHKNISLSSGDMSPNGTFFINTIETSQMAPLSQFSKPYYNLAGLQVDRQGNRNRFMTLTTTAGLEVIEAGTGNALSVNTPENARITTATWSPDGSKLAYFAHFDDATHIYIVAMDRRNRATKVTKRPVLATLITSIEWSPDSRYIYTVVMPKNRGMEPAEPTTPNSIQVLKTTPEENRLRTYQSLLKNRNEGELFEYYTKGQLVRIDTEKSSIREIGEPAMFESIDPSPDNEYMIIQKLQKPFSYVVPYYSFAWVEQIWDTQGNMITELRNSEVNEGVPDHDEIHDEGRTDIKWRPDGQGLSLIIEPEEEKDEDKDSEKNTDEDEAEKEEKIYKIVQWKAPFGEDDMQVLYETKGKMESVMFSDDSEILFVREEKGSTEHLYALYAGQMDTTYTIYKHDSDDFYENPGNILFKPGSSRNVVLTNSDGKHVYLRGVQYFENFNEKAPQPYLDKVAIQSDDKERIFESSADFYEEVTAILDRDAKQLVIERQSASTHPDFWLVDNGSNSHTKLTENVDYNKSITQTRRDRFKVKRADGFEFWVEVILPPNWDGKPLPGLIWHYPSEFDDQEDYDENLRDYNKNDFPGIYRRSTDILVTRGYAVIDADWPISAERGSPNEGFVWSIVQNSTAVIDSVVKRGYVDRERMAIGGHSYGAFGTANAMIHTSFFKAGIAGDGNYNRTLTPLGFQREPDDLWRGQDKYMEMSPIFWADRLDGALLMYHGEADQNVGTWPIHSLRMFHALNGIGKTAAMYMYPHEAHGPASEETMLDLWKRWSDWLDHYVKNLGEHVQETELDTDN